MRKNIPIAKNVFKQRPTDEIKSRDNVFGEFLVKEGLYKEIDITENNISELLDLLGGHVKIDIYCPVCKESRVFCGGAIPHFWYDENKEVIKASLLEDEIWGWVKYQQMIIHSPGDASQDSWTWTSNLLKEDTRIMVFSFFCAMDNAHHLDYVVLTQGNKMIKIGQYPSLADLTIPELKEYRKVMTEVDAKELRRASGLFSAGIGVGSFVYLRRIFERIIVQASQMAIKDGEIDEAKFAASHNDERVKMLANYLPKILYSNPVFYRIVSKGIHELSEEECLDYFPVLYSFITMTLDQWETMRKEVEKEKEIARSLNVVAEKINN